MTGKRLFFTLAAALIAVALSQPPRVSPQQNPPCAGNQTGGQTEGQTAAKTIKQINLAICNCEQSSAQGNPTYRVGAAPFGRSATLRVGRSARRGQQLKPKDLYDGLEMPDLSV